MRFASSLAALALCTFCGAAACHTPTVAEAEEKGDVAALDAFGTSDATAALGRIADKDPKAVAALESKSGHDVNAFIAAWGAILRGAGWGTKLMREGLADPTRSELAASALPRRDTRVSVLAPDLEQAIVRLAAGSGGAVVAAVLASIGPSAHPLVERRLTDAKTRGAMCNGIGSPDASGDAKSTLLAVPIESRDNASCIDVVLELARNEDAVLGWLAVNAEPGLLSAAGKNPTLPCPRLQVAWKRALTERAPSTFAALTVPMSYAVKRCASALDATLAELITTAPAARTPIVMALDPFGTETTDLNATCKVLPLVERGGDAPVVRERAGDTLGHACQNTHP